MTAQTDATTAAAQTAGLAARTEPDHGYFPRTEITNADGTFTLIHAPDAGAAIESGMAEGWLIDRVTRDADGEYVDQGSTAWLDPACTPEQVVDQAVDADR